MAPAAPEPGAVPTHLLAACPELLQASVIHVAFSGGLDSTVLLHLLYCLRQQGLLQCPLHAVHVNHRLQASADQWEQQCRSVCAALELDFTSIPVAVDLDGGDSPEESARKARHAAFAALLAPGAVIVLAQHQDDQVETVLFRLLRGSGASGLAGMPRVRPCGNGLLLRPLLDISRASLRVYGEAAGLHWIEDPSNEELRFDRNFLRKRILPQLQQRWPGVAQAVSRSARLSAETADLLAALAELDLAQVRGAQPTVLRCPPLLQFDVTRQRNLLHHWLWGLHYSHGFAAPTHQVLEATTGQLLLAAPDANPSVSWGQAAAAGELHRFRDELHVLKPLPPVPASLVWQTAEPLVLPEPLGILRLVPALGPGLALARVETLEVRFRSGGEQVRLPGRPQRPLKKLLQELGIPTWRRNHIPLFYCAGNLVAVADLLVCDGWQNEPGQNACHIQWQRPDSDCG